MAQVTTALRSEVEERSLYTPHRRVRGLASTNASKFLSRLSPSYLTLMVVGEASGSDSNTPILSRTEATGPFDNSSSSRSDALSYTGEKRARRMDEDDGDEEDRKDKRNNNNKRVDPSSDSQRLRLACPYFKRNPASCAGIRTCTGPGWPSIHRVKYYILNS
jgi:hypothetical protein